MSKESFMEPVNEKKAACNFFFALFLDIHYMSAILKWSPRMCHSSQTTRSVVSYQNEARMPFTSYQYEMWYRNEDVALVQQPG